LADAILSPHLKSINYALLFFGCLIFHLAGTWNLPLIDRDEPRFAEASREMIERGDYVVPHFNNQLRLDKPPFTYWAQVASFTIFGENDFAARFPSAFAATLIAFSILGWGSRIGKERVGLCAAIIFTLSLQTFLHAKAAVADMWLVLFVTLAHWAGYELIQRPTSDAENIPEKTAQDRTLNSEASHQTSNIQHPISRRWWLIFYVALAFAFLAKGPIGWTPLLTVGSTILFSRDLHLAHGFKFVRGTLLMLAIVAIWGIPALIRTHGEFLIVGIGRHVIGRSFGAMEGHGANSLGAYLALLPFYFVTVFASFFPWSIKLPWLTRNLWQKRDNIDNYLLAGTAAIFIIFTLIKTKLPHYTLPAFPLLSLLLARYWSCPERLATRKLDRFKQSSLCGVEIQAAVGDQSSLFKGIAIATMCLWLTIALVIPSLTARSFPAYTLFQESRDYLRPEMEFGAVDYQEPSLVWYFRSQIRGTMTPLRGASASQFMNESGPRFVVLPTQLAGKIFLNRPPTWKAFSTQGFNIAKGRPVDLTLVLKPD
jgi:4-amino-4-deoxy-L-arabinose transferase-like glycosyltransferase